ncbi:MAG: hypothetical protein V2A73_15230 [Pseudomonadota bacterium]
MKHIPVLAFLVLVACDTKDNGIAESRVVALETKVAELQVQLAEMKTRLEAHDTSLANAQPTLAQTEELLAVMQLNADGDIVISDANLFVQSGSGTTNGALNGKGNLIVGYDEDDTEGTCNGGPLDGQPCENTGACGIGTCDGIHAVSQKTGSHNVVIGIGHTYTAGGGLVAGATNRLLSDSVSVVGGVGQTADTYGQVLP